MALELIDRVKLYDTIFANVHDDARPDTSSWSVAYNALATLLSPQNTSAPVDRVRQTLIHETSDVYYAWIVATFAPWSSVPGRVAIGPKAKPLPPRPAELARDGLRSDNKTIAILSESAQHWRSIIDVKSSLLEDRMDGTDAEIRQQVGLHIRSWKREWRLCVVLSMLQELMQGGEFSQGGSAAFPRIPFEPSTDIISPSVVQEYDKFLTYIVDHDLQDATELKPIVNGGEVMQHFGGKKGPWLAKALDMVVEWQLLHPECTDKDKVLEMLSARKEELGCGSA